MGKNGVYFPIAEPMLYKSKWIIVIWAQGGQNRPYKSPKDFHAKIKDYKLYVRRYSITGNLKKAIDNLLKQGLIEYTIPNKPTSKNQKYKLSSQS